MDGGSHDTLWEIVRDVLATAVLGLGGIVAWLWRKLNAVDAISQRLDVLAASVEDMVERQEQVERDQRQHGMLLAKIEETLSWLREAITEIKHKLDK